MPRVSIGLPVYNGERFLGEAIDSILAQTFKDFELIISDNASTDKTHEICRAYAAQDRRIKYYRNQANLGAVWNFNRVFKLSKGKYFQWASYDDKWHPNFLSRCIEILEQKPQFVLCYPRIIVIDEAGGIINIDEKDLNLDSPDIVVRFYNTLSPMKFCDSPFYGLMRKSLLSKTRLIGNYLATDRCLLAELALYGPFWKIPEQLFYRRRHSGNMPTSIKSVASLDPSKKVSFVLPECRVFFEHLASIKRAPLDLPLKVRLVFAICRWATSRTSIFTYQSKNAVKQMMLAYFPQQFVLKLEKFRNRKAKKYR